MTSVLGVDINFPLLSIPIFYVLAVYPHGHAVLLAAQGNLQRYDNRNPKSSSLSSSIQKRLGAKDFRAWERAESCHRNHLENMALFCSAIFAGLLAEQKIGNTNAIRLNEFAFGWLVIRTLYTINYLATETVKWSYLRSALYFAGSLWAFYVIGISALAIGS